VDVAAECELEARRTRWASGWRRVVFPGVFMVYLLQTASGVSEHASGVVAVVGYLLLAGFAVAYLRAMFDAFGGPHDAYWGWYGAMWVLFLAELPIAHEDAFAMVTYLVVLTIATMGRRSAPIVAALVLAALFLPPAIPSWHAGMDGEAALSTGLVALAMYGFFEIVRSNRALSEARAEVARLAAESERSRIARDLHDLLGHSLTTITVKAGLARRLAERDPVRAATEIGEVESLARRSLADVRAAVSGYREVTLTGELASGRELLRAAGVRAELPRSIDEVRPELHELLGWVVREGLTNVVRHSRATSCTVSLGPTWVEVVDDGVGVPRGQSGHGLEGLRERVEAAGGTLVVGPGPRGGWRLLADVPAADPADAARPPAGAPARTP
jgi:two-component system sensor histidine kinase DesK